MSTQNDAVSGITEETEAPSTDTAATGEETSQADKTAIDAKQSEDTSQEATAAKDADASAKQDEDTSQETTTPKDADSAKQDLVESQPLLGQDSKTDDEDKPDVTEDETSPLIDAGGSTEQAPPLPEKRPLPGSDHDVSRPTERSGSSSSSSSSSSHSSHHEDTEVTSPAQPTTARNVPQGDIDTIINAQPLSPNEPPPPYPGGPLPGADPYGPPAPPGMDIPPGEQRVVVEVTGSCPKCQVGNIVQGFSFCGICLAIWLFPCGLICLFCMRDKKCSHCGEKF